ncbi:hypothetical protein HYPSUDRAFT_61139 [Hypholoma sublateritium FD-334 SS-4]|uniref:Dihydrofolate reductase n=1 Tax=Hypholoma sublateritium (strain FD-334 SS-4) TaxID=945553 RepID=A0A0D2PL63_HYPSF|nr:hypothetical protein HYPSUDRAFT_61139 [Hypholoma sublateritium FD-334 SS-4]
MSPLTIIVAATKANGIGINGGLPWKLSKELKYFAQATTNAPEGHQNAVIMGRNTWESIPKKFRPLPRRKNIVISTNPHYNLDTISTSAVLAHNLKSALELSHAQTPNLNREFIIGGATLYTEAIKLPPSPTEPYVDRVLLTRILAPDFKECDVSMSDFLQEEIDGKKVWARASHKELEEWVGFGVAEGELEENGVTYEFQMWLRGV